MVSKLTKFVKIMKTSSFSYFLKLVEKRKLLKGILALPKQS
jgi:hypothetical protein